MGGRKSEELVEGILECIKKIEENLAGVFREKYLSSS